MSVTLARRINGSFSLLKKHFETPRAACLYCAQSPRLHWRVANGAWLPSPAFRRLFACETHRRSPFHPGAAGITGLTEPHHVESSRKSQCHKAVHLVSPQQGIRLPHRSHPLPLYVPFPLGCWLSLCVVGNVLWFARCGYGCAQACGCVPNPAWLCPVPPFRSPPCPCWIPSLPQRVAPMELFRMDLQHNAGIDIVGVPPPGPPMTAPRPVTKRPATARPAAPRTKRPAKKRSKKSQRWTPAEVRCILLLLGVAHWVGMGVGLGVGWGCVWVWSARGGVRNKHSGELGGCGGSI